MAKCVDEDAEADTAEQQQTVSAIYINMSNLRVLSLRRDMAAQRSAKFRKEDKKVTNRIQQCSQTTTMTR